MLHFRALCATWGASGDVWRAAVAAQGHAAEADASGEGRSTAALAASGSHPADQTARAYGMHRAERLIAAIALSASRGGAKTWKRYDHAHRNFTIL